MTVLLAASTLLILAPGCHRAPAAVAVTADPRPWNFLIVVVDTLRYDVTSMAGQPNSPFLQSVARRGVSFSRAFSTHDSTPPSHFTLFTGLREGLGLANDRPDMSLAYQLRERGYDTFGVAANGNLSQKWMQSLAGFTRYENLYDDWVAMRPEQRAARLPAINARLDRYQARHVEWNQAQMFCSGDEVLTRFRRIVSAATEPFFGFVNITEPHDPYLPSATSLGREPDFAANVDPDVRFRTLRFPLADPRRMKSEEQRAYVLRRLEAAQGRHWSLSDDLTTLEIETYKRRYAAAVRDADQVVRSIFLELERKQIQDRTWVVVVSDHGESFGEGGFMTHSLSNRGDAEATLRVPMVWAPPSRFSGGVTIHDDVSLADVAPTIYDLAGVDWTPLKLRASGEFGRSLIGDLAVVAEERTSEAATGAGISESDRKRLREDALERLRALGYIQ